MIRWLVLMCVFGVFFLFLTACNESDSVSWKELATSGKGVMLAKTRANNGSDIYYVASGTNRVMPLHELKMRGVRFTSFDSLLEFVELKPAEVVLVEATSDLVQEDDGKLEPLSESERQIIWGSKTGLAGKEQRGLP